MVFSRRRHRRLFIAIGVVLSLALFDNVAMAQVDYTWQNIGAGDWGGTGVNYNWDDPLSVGGDPAPEGRFGEGAIIDNGGTARVTTVYDNSGTGTFGPGYVTINGDSTLQITGGGDLQLDDSDALSSGAFQIGEGGSAGSLIIESGGALSATTLALFQPGSSIDLDGTASITLTGSGDTNDANLARNVRFTGPNVNFTTNSLQFGENTVLIPEITSASSHSTIQVATNATLEGAVQAEFNGVSPSLGDTWNLVEAATVTGTFDSVSATGATFLPGQRVVVQQVPNGGTTLVQLALEQQLYLEVNRNSGAIAIKSSDSSPISFDGYTVNSPAGSLKTANGVWDSLGDQAVAGWVEANPSATRLSEVQISGSTNVTDTSTISLGSPFSPAPVAFGDPVDDLSFQYVNETGDVVNAMVEYTGTNVNNLALIVDPATGEAQLRNASDFSFAIDGYTIRSTSSALDVGGWQSLADDAVDGWVEANPSAGRLSEVDINAATVLSPDSTFDLGDLFSGTVVEDLALQFVLDGEEEIRDGVILYQEITIPGDFDGDGDVDGNDLTDPTDGWQARFGSDLSGTDFLTWQRNFGFGVGAVSASLNNVPEPGTFCSMLLVSFCFSAGCRLTCIGGARR